MNGTLTSSRSVVGSILQPVNQWGLGNQPNPFRSKLLALPLNHKQYWLNKYYLSENIYGGRECCSKSISVVNISSNRQIFQQYLLELLVSSKIISATDHSSKLLSILPTFSGCRGCSCMTCVMDSQSHMKKKKTHCRETFWTHCTFDLC